MSFRSFILVSFLLSGYALQSANRPATFRTDIVADGQNLEWSSPLPRYDKKTGINYDVSNDEHRLYLILRIADEKVQQQVLKNGLEVWIDKEGKKSKITGISFPLPISTQKKNGPESKRTTPLQGGVVPDAAPSVQPVRNRIMPESVRDLKLNGFLIDNGIHPVKSCPVNVGLRMDDAGCMIYELAVPFNTFFKEMLEPDDQELSIGFTFLIKADDSSDDGNLPSMGMMMGGPGMGGPDGPPPGMMGGRSSFDNTSTGNLERKCWFKVVLSNRP